MEPSGQPGRAFSSAGSPSPWGTMGPGVLSWLSGEPSSLGSIFLHGFLWCPRHSFIWRPYCAQFPDLLPCARQEDSRVPSLKAEEGGLPRSCQGGTGRNAGEPTPWGNAPSSPESNGPLPPLPPFPARDSESAAPRAHGRLPASSGPQPSSPAVSSPAVPTSLHTWA